MVLLSVPNTGWGYVTRRKVPTEDNDLGDEVHFYAIVKHFSDPLQRGGVIQPHVRENKEVEVGKFLFDSNRIPRLDVHRLNIVRIHVWKAAYVFLRCCYSLSKEVNMTVYGSINNERGSRFDEGSVT